MRIARTFSVVSATATAEVERVGVEADAQSWAAEAQRYSAAVDQANESAVLLLRKKATTAGASAILGLQLQTRDVSFRGWSGVLVFASGTPCVLQPIAPPTAPGGVSTVQGLRAAAAAVHLMDVLDIDS
jgi:uncharacterized protein YbjQ (UPF0145 family)